MSNENKDRAKENTAAVVEAVSKTELFFSSNKVAIISVIAVLIIAGAGFFLWHKYGYMPQKAEAQEQMYPAEANFRSGEYELALNGDGNVLGFAQIIEDYGHKAGEAVYFYAGVCELQLGNYSEALGYLTSYRGKDKILLARATACIGDAYTGLEDYAKAAAYFEKAAAIADNMFAAGYLLKAGVTYEELGQKDKALAAYKTIKDKYPQSMQGYDIDKYISRIEAE
ncbi:MAG: tetratricopeptide repeat protein [Bacteroidetes bacterium]|uniref:Tetratricopeptide repeat protein n=1 Tax=Candidatus Cryptobacteroides excrementavium TaxID=2840759 RepID=A0A9D9J1T0_9BACT|nr:tetratricopeptide repeat protein [Candidatus Cryptobacteroides excrementavium]